jgi:hypothetical protein
MSFCNGSGLSRPYKLPKDAKNKIKTQTNILHICLKEYEPIMLQKSNSAFNSPREETNISNVLKNKRSIKKYLENFSTSQKVLNKSNTMNMIDNKDVKIEIDGDDIKINSESTIFP